MGGGLGGEWDVEEELEQLLHDPGDVPEVPVEPKWVEEPEKVRLPAEPERVADSFKPKPASTNERMRQQMDADTALRNMMASLTATTASPEDGVPLLEPHG